MTMEWIDWLQWPGMVSSLAAAWLVGSRRSGARALGFWVFLASNALWIVWGVHTEGWALVALQVGLATLNIRGVCKNGSAARNADGELSG